MVEEQRDGLHRTCLLFLILCLGLKHLVEAGGSEPPRGVQEQDVLLEAEGHAGRDAEAHLERQGCGSSKPPKDKGSPQSPLTLVAAPEPPRTARNLVPTSCWGCLVLWERLETTGDATSA